MSFQATNRVGFVLRGDSALTWLQAERVIAHLRRAEIIAQFNKLHREVLDGQEAVAFLKSEEYQGHEKVLSAHENRGQLYHSDYAVVSLYGFKVYLSFTYTVCVRFPVPGNPVDTNTVESKFWYSAMLVGEADKPDIAKLAQCLSMIRMLAAEVREATLPAYEAAINDQNSAVGKIRYRENVEMIDTVVEMVDPEFQAAVERLVTDRSSSLSREKNSSALRTLNDVFASDAATVFLHEGRSALQNEGGADCEIWPTIERPETFNPVYYIDSRRADADPNGKFCHRSFGVVSTPKERAESLLSYDGKELAHSYGSRISAQRVADLAELF